MLRSTIFGTWAALGLLLATGGGCAYLQQHCECIRSPMLKWAVGCCDSDKCQSCKKDTANSCNCQCRSYCSPKLHKDACCAEACGCHCGCGSCDGGAKAAALIPAVPAQKSAPAPQPREKAKSVEPTMPWPGEIPAAKSATAPAAQPAKESPSDKSANETPAEPASPQQLPKVLPPLNKPEAGEDGLIPLAPSSGDERPIGPEKTKKAASLLKRLSGSPSSQVVGCMAAMPSDDAESSSRPASPLRPVASSVSQGDFGVVRVFSPDTQAAPPNDVPLSGNPLR